MATSNRSCLNFEDEVRRWFAFLDNFGFSVIESLPTLVRYQNGSVVVDVYHGRQSYEIGAGVAISGTRYAISEIINAKDPGESKQFRYAMTTTPEGVSTALKELGSLLEKYGNAALQGNPKFILILKKQRNKWSEQFSLDVLARQLRPQANEAFRRKDYSSAVDLYSRIRERLSAAEIRKLDFAIRHSRIAQS